MAWKQCWLLLAAGALSAVVTSGSARTANDDGICTRVTYYVARDGNRATDGTTLTYCANERDCHRRADKVCCNGWRRDPDSKKLRCLKIDSNNSTSRGAVGIGTGVRGAEESTSSPDFSYVIQKEAGAQKNVRRPRDSPSASGNTVAVTHRNVNVSARADSLSVQNAEVAPPNTSADLATKGDGKSEIGAVQRKLTDFPVVAVGAGSDTSHSSTNGNPPVEPPGSNTGDSRSMPDSGSIVQPPATSSRGAPHASTEKDNVFSKSNTEGSGTTQGPLKNGPASANGPSAGDSNQAEATPHVIHVSEAIHPESKNNASSHSVHSEIGHSGIESQTPPKKNHSDQSDDAVQTRGQAAIVSSSATTAPTADSAMASSMASQTPVPTTNVKITTNTPQVQPHGDQPQVEQPTSTLRPAGDNSVHIVTAVTPGVTTTNKSLVGQDSNHSSTNRPVVSIPVDSDQNTNSTNQSTQDTTSLTLTSKDLAHGRHEDTVLSSTAFQSTSAAPVLHTNGTTPTITTTKPPVSAATSASTTGAAASHPQLVNASTTATTTPTQSISHGATTPAGVAKATTVPAPQHRKFQTRGELKYGDRCNDSSQCGYDHGICGKQSGKQLCLCEPEYPVTNHIDMCGKPAKINETCEFSEQCERTTEKTECRDGRCVCLFQMGALYKNDGSVECVDNIHKYNVTGVTSKDNGSATQRSPAGNSSVPTGQQGGASVANVTQKNDNGTSVVNCTAADHTSNCSAADCSLDARKNCSHSNNTGTTARPQPSTAPPVAKPLGDKPHGGTALPSTSSASKTASEVTISLLLVAAVAFVAALLYWRSRRRRRRYINCGTREPNLNFSNPVYDLEAMMEQTSLVKLQNAADIEDGDDSDSGHEATFQRK